MFSMLKSPFCGLVGSYGHILLYVSDKVKIILGHFLTIFLTLWDTFRGVGGVSQIVYILGHAASRLTGRGRGHATDTATAPQRTAVAFSFFGRVFTPV